MPLMFHFSLKGFPTDQRNGDKEFVIRRAATNRVLNVLRHWVSKHCPVTLVQSLLFIINHNSRPLHSHRPEGFSTVHNYRKCSNTVLYSISSRSLTLARCGWSQIKAGL